MTCSQTPLDKIGHELNLLRYAPDGPLGFVLMYSKHGCLDMSYYQIEFLILTENMFE